MIFIRGGEVSRLLRGKASVVILLLSLFLVTAPQYYRSLVAGSGLPITWLYAPKWLESADCARTTGVILVLCRDGKLVPIADETSGDDPGHALALELYSLITQKPVLPGDISILNSTINYIGLIALSLLLFSLRLPFAAFLVLTIGPALSDQFHRLTPHPAQFGAACLAAILPLAILGFAKTKSDRRLVCFWLATGFLCLATAALFRQAIGLMGAVAGCLAVAFAFVIQSRGERKALQCFVMIVGILTITQVPTILMRVRDAVYHVPATRMMEQHGVWHNLYIGLGVVENPFGIEWLDANGEQNAKKINPSVEFATMEYFRTLRTEYFRIVRQHPYEVAKIYAKKLALTANTALRFRMIGVKTSLICIFILATLAYWRAQAIWRPQDSVFAVSSLFVCFFIAQAVLFHPSDQYLFPIQIFFLMCAGALIEILVLQRNQKRSVKL
ncbi:hypothetical protein V1291_000353 [Nitrobacteraceae bacterium AZCC 1564]